VASQQVHYQLQIRRRSSVAFQQREDARLGRDPAHLLDGGDAEIDGELIRVGEKDVRAKGQVELVATKPEGGSNRSR
jgi:hypothetical protein